MGVSEFRLPILYDDDDDDEDADVIRCASSPQVVPFVDKGMSVQRLAQIR